MECVQNTAWGTHLLVAHHVPLSFQISSKLNEMGGGDHRQNIYEEASFLLSSQWSSKQAELIPFFSLEKKVFSSKNKKNGSPLVVIIDQTESQGSQRF